MLNNSIDPPAKFITGGVLFKPFRRKGIILILHKVAILYFIFIQIKTIRNLFNKEVN